MDFKAKKKIKIEVTSDRDHKTSVLNIDQSINIVYFSTSPLHFNVCGYIIFPFLFFFFIKVLFPSGAKVVIRRNSWGLDVVIKTPRAIDRNQEGGLCVYPGPYNIRITDTGFRERYEKRTLINVASEHFLCKFKQILIAESLGDVAYFVTAKVKYRNVRNELSHSPYLLLIISKLFRSASLFL